MREILSRNQTLAIAAAAALVLTATQRGGLAGAQPDDGAPGTEHFVAYTWNVEPGRYDNLIATHWLVRRWLDPERVKAATDAMPEGHRVVLSWDLHRWYHNNPLDCCRDPAGKLTDQPGIWWDHGVEEIAARFDDFFARYKAIGGRVDAVVLDAEVGLSNWALGRYEERYRAIMADPRFEPIARQLGFRDLLTVMNWQQQRGPAQEHFRIWNGLMHRRVAQYVNRAVYEPIRKHYPHVKLSNWGGYYNAPEFACPDLNGHEQSRFSRGAHVGTHQSGHLYCEIGQIGRRTLPGGNRPYGDSPFAGFRLSVNRMRSMVLSSDVPVWPWISHKQYQGSRVRESDLYQELIFHAGLCGPDAFLFWNPQKRLQTQKSEHFTDDSQDRLVSDCLRQLEELVGTADRKTLVTGLAGWYDDYVLTGMHADGRTVWRFTPRLEAGQTWRDTQVDPAAATFRVGGTTVHIPGGTVHRAMDDLSTQGLWIIAPAESRPIVSAAD